MGYSVPGIVLACNHPRPHALTSPAYSHPINQPPPLNRWAWRGRQPPPEERLPPQGRSAALPRAVLAPASRCVLGWRSGGLAPEEEGLTGRAALAPARRCVLGCDGVGRRPQGVSAGEEGC